MTNGVCGRIRVAAWGVSWAIAGCLAAPAAGQPCSETWSPVGTGIPGGGVLALVAYDGALVAGGTFTTASGGPANRIARFDGQQWLPLGGGMSGTVRGLTVYDGELIATGDFSEAGATPVPFIARWDGVRWRTMPGGMTNYGRAVAVSGDDLFVGGIFSDAGGVGAPHVAGFDGSDWFALGQGVSNAPTSTVVSALLDWNGSIVVGGWFHTAGTLPAVGVARWDGAWHSFAGGVNGTVGAMTVYEQALVVGGRFASINGQSMGNLARWGGSAWQNIGGGVSRPVGSADIHAMTVFGGDLIVGGDFTSAGGSPASKIARWDGLAWQAMGGGPGGSVSALLVFDDGTGPALHAGGLFSAGPGVFFGVARWNGCPAECAADLNNDGVLDFFDVQAFLNAYAAGHAEADFNGDGLFDFFDVQAFLNAYAGGCP